MALFNSALPTEANAPTLSPPASFFARSHGADGHHPTIRREEEFDEDRLSGEYYSGEEFYEDDSMLSGDRYYSSYPFSSSHMKNQTTKLSLLVFLRYQTSDTEYETPKGYHHPDAYYDDDEQPLYHDSQRSPKRRLLPATPQGELQIHKSFSGPILKYSV